MLFELLNSILFFSIFGFPFFGIIIAVSAVMFFYLGFKGRVFSSDVKNKDRINIDAFLSCVGGSVGIGNIIGGVVSVQVAGAGVVFWIFFSSIFLSIIKFYEVYISCLFIDKDNKDIQKQKNSKQALTGPFFYIKHLFTRVPRWKILTTVLFWIFAISFTLGYLAVGVIQVNQIILLSKGGTLFKILLASLISILIFVFAFYKQSWLHSLSKIFVPFMVAGLFYLCFSTIFINFDRAGNVVSQIFTEAFKPSVAAIGFLYSIALQRLTLGADIGTGISGLLNSFSKSDTDYRKQAILSAFESVVVGVFMSLIGFTILIGGSDISKSFGLETFHEIVVKGSKLKHVVFLCLIFSFGITTAVTRLYAFLYGFLAITNNRFKLFAILIFAILCILSFSYGLKDVLGIVDAMLLFASIINVFCMVIYALRINKNRYV